MSSNRFSEILREPLLHFFLIGVALFVLYAVVGGDSETPQQEIVVDSARLAALAATFERTWQRPPDATEMRGLVDSWVREEILYREGLSIGLDREDPVVRRRVAQKMDFVTEGFAGSAPGDAELQAWLDENAADYRVPARYDLRQIYFDPTRHDDNLADVVAAAAAKLRRGEADQLGDSTLLPGTLADVSEDEVARVFGNEFANSLAELETGSWQGPVASGYGSHLVFVNNKTPARKPELAEVRDAVERDVTRVRVEEIRDALYQALVDKYTVIIENGATAADKPGGEAGQ